LDDWTETDEKGKTHTLSLYPGCVAFARPFEAIELAQYVEAFPTQTMISLYTVARERLVRINGLIIEDTLPCPTCGERAFDRGDTTLICSQGHEWLYATRRVPFNAKDRQHLISVGEKALVLVYRAIMTRAELVEADEKNSVSPSASGEMSNGKRSSAGGAKKRNATTSGAVSRATSGRRTRSDGPKRLAKVSSSADRGVSPSANAETTEGMSTASAAPGPTP
jgi:hypothetical protein